MDSRVTTVLAQYGQRAQREGQLMERIPLDEAMRRVDEFLISIGPDTSAPNPKFAHIVPRV